VKDPVVVVHVLLIEALSFGSGRISTSDRARFLDDMLLKLFYARVRWEKWVSLCNDLVDRVLTTAPTRSRNVREVFQNFQSCSHSEPLPFFPPVHGLISRR
jgi:hypothetical protein